MKFGRATKFFLTVLIMSFGFSVVAYAQIGSDSTVVSKLAASSSIQNANKSCPKPNSNQIYTNKAATGAIYLGKINLWHTNCPTDVKGANGSVKIQGICEAQGECRASWYKGPDGKRHYLPTNITDTPKLKAIDPSVPPPVPLASIPVPPPPTFGGSSIDPSDAFTKGVEATDAPYVVNPVTGKLESLAKQDSLLNPENAAGSIKNFNYVSTGPTATLAGANDPASALNGSISSISSEQPTGPQSGFGAAGQIAGESTQQSERESASCGWWCKTKTAASKVADYFSFTSAAYGKDDNGKGNLMQGDASSPEGVAVYVAPVGTPGNSNTIVAAPNEPMSTAQIEGELLKQRADIAPDGLIKQKSTGVTSLDKAYKLLDAGVTRDVPSFIRAWNEPVIQEPDSKNGASKDIYVNSLPVTAVEKGGDLAPVPGAVTLYTAQSRPVVPDATVDTIPVPYSGPTRPSPEVDSRVRTTFDVQMKSANDQINYARDLRDRSESPAAKAAAQVLLEESYNRWSAVYDNYQQYLGDVPTPKVQQAIERLDTGKGAGTIASAFTAVSDSANKVADAIAPSIPINEKFDITTLGGIGDATKLVGYGAVWLGAKAVGGVASAGQDLLQQVGAPGFQDPQQDLVDAVDPYLKDYKTAATIGVLVPIVGGPVRGAVKGVLDVAVGGGGTVARGVAGEVGYIAGTVGRESVETVVPKVVPRVISSGEQKIVAEGVGAVGPKAMNNLAGEINAGIGVSTRSVGSLSQIPKSAFDVAPKASPYGAIDAAVADVKAAATQGSRTPLVATESVVAPAGQGTVRSGVSAEISVGPRAALDAVWKQTPGSWTGAVVINGGLLCGLYCPKFSTTPQQLEVPVEIISASSLNLPPFPGTATDFPAAYGAPPVTTSADTDKIPVAPPITSSQPESPIVAAPLPVEEYVVPSNYEDYPGQSVPVVPAQPVPAILPAVTPVKDTTPPPVVSDSSAFIAEQRAISDAQAQTIKETSNAVKSINRAEMDAEDAQRRQASAQRIADATAKAQASLMEALNERNARIVAERAQAEAEALAQAQAQADAVAAASRLSVTHVPLPEIVTPPVVNDTFGTQTIIPVTSAAIAQSLAPAGGGSGNKVSLEITFVSGSAVLTNEGRAAVEQLAGAMTAKELSQSSFTIIGHTDTVAPARGITNQTLSERRAQTVVTTLSSFYGIPMSQMTATGVGDTQLKVNQIGDVAANRRVEIIATPRK